MSPVLILVFISLYTLLLFGVTFLTSRGATNETYFVGNRSSNWLVVSYGMIGASLSGVTFMSVPGGVGDTQLWYFQVVLGYFFGYFIIAQVLLPIYYKMNLTSIYSYLGERLGMAAYKTGAFFFILSRVLGAACRMYIVILVLQKFVFEPLHIPFIVTTAIFILLILAYTFKGGVKTIVWTDMLQTTFMLLSLVLSVILISKALNFSDGFFSHISSSSYSGIFNWNWKSGYFFPKAFLGGMFIAVTMTGMDQEMMQKNISCKNIGEAKKNVITFSFIMVVANLLFLALGILLWEYSKQTNFAGPHGEMTDRIQTIFDRMKDGHLRTDELFPHIALSSLGTVSALFFIIGLISAAFPSADGALTALTASFCIDFLGFNRKENPRTEEQKIRTRKMVHLAFAAILLLTIVILNAATDRSVIDNILFFATITYGPLLGLFAFGILTKRNVNHTASVVISIIIPAICFIVGLISRMDKANVFLGGYKFGNELLIINGGLIFIGLLLFSKKERDIA